MFYTEMSYIQRISYTLERYKVVNINPYSINFRCPICGDSQTHKQKARAYIYEKKGQFKYNCFNCGVNFPFWVFLKDYYPNIYLDYKIDWMKNKFGDNYQSISIPDFSTKTEFDTSQFFLGTQLSLLQDDNVFISYVKSRCIPFKYWKSLWGCSDINLITRQIDKYKNAKFVSEPVIVVPLYNEYRKFSYISVRTISPSSFMRYLILGLDEVYPKIWGLEFIDYNKPIFILEGQFDAMCVENALALLGTSKAQSIEYLSNKINNIKDIIFVFDSDFRYNKEVRKTLERTISDGYSVVLFDKYFRFKDINEAITKGNWSFKDVQEYLSKRIFSGLRAKIELSNILKLQNR